MAGMPHARASPRSPQSNGKRGRRFKTLKGDCIRVRAPPPPDGARRPVADFVAHSDEVRPHGAIGSVTPAARLAGRHTAIFEARDRKRVEARRRRKQPRQAGHEARRRQPPVTDRPAIDFDAIRAAVPMAAVPQLPGFRARTPHGARRRGPGPGTARPPAPAGASPSATATRPSPASSAAAPATPWTAGPRPRDQRPTTRRSTSAGAGTSRCRCFAPRHPRTGKRKPWRPDQQPVQGSPTEREYRSFTRELEWANLPDWAEPRHLQVRNLLRRLERELEISGNRIGPACQDRNLGQTMERAVEINGTKTLAVETEHLLGRQVLGIERALPLLVGIAACTDEEVHGSFTRQKSPYPIADGVGLVRQDPQQSSLCGVQFSSCRTILDCRTGKRVERHRTATDT